MRKQYLSSLCILSLVLSGCQKPFTEEKKTIGIAVYDQNDAFIQSIANHLEECMEDDNQFNYTITDAFRSQTTENKNISDLLSDGADILCVNLVDRTEPSDIIHEAKKYNVPVIFFNREPVESDLKRWDRLYYVGANAEESGRLQGQIIANYIQSHPEIDRNNDEIIQYYVLEGETGHQDAIIRSESSIATLEDAGIPVEKQGYAICDWRQDLAEEKVSGLIADNTQIELFICNNDAMAIGAIEAYENADIPLEERPAIAGIDGTKEGLHYIKEQKMIGSVYNDASGQAEAIYNLAKALLTYQSLDSISLTDNTYIRLPYQKITYENVDAFE